MSGYGRGCEFATQSGRLGDLVTFVNNTVDLSSHIDVYVFVHDLRSLDHPQT
jgi:hypothetical protein